MKSKTEWADIIYRDRLEENKVYLHIERICAEHDEALREKMIQKLWFKAKGLSGKNPMILLAIVEIIINETQVDKRVEEKE